MLKTHTFISVYGISPQYIVSNISSQNKRKQKKEAEEMSIHNVDRVLKKKIWLGECQGNCYKNTDCAHGYSCSRRNKDALIAKGYDSRLAFCPTQESKGGYVCYNPSLANYPACPNGVDKLTVCDPSGTGFFNGSNACLFGDILACCRESIGRFNRTHSKCTRYQKCDSSQMFQCDSQGQMSRIFYDAICLFQNPCAPN